MEQNTTVNRERRIKKHVIAGTHSVELIAQPGFQTATVAECKKLVGEKRTAIDKTHIEVDGLSFDEVLKLVYLSKTIDDVWLKLAQFRFKGLTGLRAQLDDSLVPLTFDAEVTQFEFKVEIIKSHFQDKKDLAKFLSEYFPKNDKTKATKRVVVQVRLFRDVFSIFVPLAGEPLYKRSFRSTTQVDAPLKETLASGAIQTFFNTHPATTSVDTLLVPFGGSGTFLFEYWMTEMGFVNHANRALQLEYLSFYPKAKCEHLKKKSLEGKKDFEIRSIYCDSSEKAVVAFQKNRLQFGELYSAAKNLADKTEIIHGDFFSLDMSLLKNAKHVFMPLNPPYGLRLQKQSIDKFYADIAKQILKIKTECPRTGVSGLVLCPSETTWTHLLNGLKPFKTTTQHFMQGGLDIRLVLFTTF